MDCLVSDMAVMCNDAKMLKRNKSVSCRGITSYWCCSYRVQHFSCSACNNFGIRMFYWPYEGIVVEIMNMIPCNECDWTVETRY